MPRIHHLGDHLISQIAAGEVVERPASVVKELVENALDAAATDVSVELEGGGKRRIRVVDDGCGMGRDDALLAFDRHATSKIASFEDLQSVATLGFRGEALASIAAVSRVELVTAELPGEGARVRIEGGRVRAVEPAARARGTTLDIGSLFFNVPARRKFLKQGATELRRCVEVLQGYCLVQPSVRLSLRHEGRLLVDAVPAGDGSGGLRERIRQLFGASLADALVELPAGGKAGERLGGFVGDRRTASPRRLFVFVNGRLLRDRQILAVYYRTVREEWQSEEFPSLFLFLELPPEDVDVNVHPQKAEVRFRDPGVLERLRGVLAAGLRQARGAGAAPLRPMTGAVPPVVWQGLGERGEAGAGWSRPVGAAGELREGASSWLTPGTAGVPVGGPAGGKLAEVAYRPPAAGRVPLSGPGGEDRSVSVLGQYKGSLLLLEAADGLLLVDQHAAHERILYEELARALAADVPHVQRLLVPRLLELGPAERLRLADLAGELAPLGFHVDPMSGGDLALAAVPAALSEDEAVDLLGSLAAASDGRPLDAAALRRELLAAAAAGQACRGAIKIHHPLSAGHSQELVARLFACADPWACPHGRPTVLRMTDAELERRFGRR